MAEEELIISLHKGTSKEEILDMLARDTTSDSSVDSTIFPDRPVNIENERVSSNRVFHAIITSEEAIKLQRDPRIMGVNRVPVWDDDWLDTIQSGTWSRTGAAGNHWGLQRIATKEDPWYSINSSASNPNVALTNAVGYAADGTGVDYINQEGGLPAIPSETSWSSVRNTSTNRYQQFQWNTLPNCSNMASISYTDSSWWSDHATTVTQIAVGRLVGVARNANIYALPINYIQQGYWFDAIKEFHKAKTPDPYTGAKRPTVVNASWGTQWYSSYIYNSTSYETIQRLNFRGSTITGSSKADFVDLPDYALDNKTSYQHIGDIYPSMRAEIEDMIDEGVIYISSAGNTGGLIDSPTGLDWDNTVTLKNQTYHPISSISGDTFYYCRGSSNTGNGSIEVGAVDYNYHADLSYANTKETIASFSCRGPGVPIYAPGWAAVDGWDGEDNSSFSAGSWGAGTSYAAPLVSGLVCQLLQLSPQMTAPRVKEWLVNNGVEDILFDNNKSESNTAIRFNDILSLWSGNNVVAYNPFWVVQNQDVFTELYNISNNTVDLSS